MTPYHQKDYGKLVDDKAARHLGVARTAVRLGVLIPVAKGTVPKRRAGVARPRLYELGGGGKKYVEQKCDTLLARWVAAFQEPWELDSAGLNGAKLKRPVEILVKKYQALPAKLALGSGMVLEHCVRKHLLLATQSEHFLQGADFRCVSWEEFLAYSPDVGDHFPASR